jgi:glycosyltransferase involved in cell wall biosynthesis
MASGLPCVTTFGVGLACDEGCYDAVIRVAVDDPKALADECLRLIQDNPLRERLSNRSRVVAQTYSSGVMATRLVALYQQVSFPKNHHS